MDKIYILELRLDTMYESKLLHIVGAFKSLQDIERYKLLFPAKNHMHQYYDHKTVTFFESVELK